MCKNSELVDHSLLHCEMAKTTWDDFFTRTGLSWVMHLDWLTSMQTREAFKVTNKWKLSREWSPYECVGVFGRRGMIEASK